MKNSKVRIFNFRVSGRFTTSRYEYLTAFRDEKRATLSLLLPTPQDPSGDVTMTESFFLTLYLNTLHVRFHVDGLEVHQKHH